MNSMCNMVCGVNILVALKEETGMKQKKKKFKHQFSGTGRTKFL